jgi:hypothetical protein
MDLNTGRELTWARGRTRGKRKLSVTPLRCRDRRLVHRPYGADSLDGHDVRYVAAMNVHNITRLLTVNKDDFKRFTNITALSPSDV